MNLRLSRFSKLLPLFLVGVLLLSSQPVFAEYFPENAAKPDPLADQKNLQGASVGEFTGSGIYEYPVSLSPGRNGMTPSISLTYNSQSEAPDNILGFRWDITQFSISRFNRHGVEELYERNDFMASLPFESGELVELGGGQYAQRFENSFAQYQYASGSGWIVTDKQGNQYLFGVNEAGRVFDPNDPTHVSEWMLEEIRDPNNNFIRYTYTRSGNRLYPSEIRYTGRGQEDGPFVVRFSLVPRNDPHYSYATGFRIDTNLLINKIELYVNGDLRRKIEIDQIQVQNFLRSTVGSITETGYDETGTPTALPPTTFEYSESDVGWEETNDYMPDWFFKSYSEGYGNSYPIVYMWDMTGDGLPDFEYTHDNVHFIQATNDGKGGWSKGDARYYNSIYSESVPNVGTKLVDFDGDTRTDILRDWEPSASIYYGKGGGAANMDIDVVLAKGSQFQNDNGGNVTDLNGDGLPDMIQGRAYFDYEEQPPSFSTCINKNGDSCPSTELWKSPMTYIRDDLHVQYPRTAYVQDCNYDGLADIQGEWWQGYYINDGKGGWLWNAPGICHFTMMDYMGNRSFDANGDGLIDRVHAEREILYVGHKDHNDIYINNGAGTGSSIAALKNRFPILLGSTEDGGVRILDLNGDKLPDIMHSQKSSELVGNDWITTETKKVWLNTGSRPYFLKTIHTSTGATIDLEYKTSAQYMKPDGTQANPKLPIIIDTVSKMKVDDGQGNVSETNYFYEDGHYYFKNSYDKTFAGFRVVTKTDGLGYQTKTYYHQSEQSVGDYANGENSDHISKKGSPYRTETYDNNSQLAAATINRFDHKTLGTDHTFPYLSQSISQTFNGGVPKATAKHYTYDDLGNVIQVLDFGEVTVTAQNGSFSDTGSDLLKTLISYIANSAMPYEQKVEAQSGALLSHTKTYYDGLPLGQKDKGNLTAQEAWLDSPAGWLRSEIEYDDYGLPTRSTNPRGFATTMSYDSFNLYPATVCNAKNQCSNSLIDIAIGKALSSTDPNGSVTETTYDGLGRPTRIEKDGELITEADYNDQSSPRSVHQTAHNDDGERVESYTYLDALDRTIESKQEAPGGKWITTQIIYDERGNVEKQIQPYFTSSSGFDNLNSGKLGTSFSYDALGRVLKATSPLGTTKNAYSGWEITTTDPNNHSKTFAKDARGSLIRVDEKNGGTYSTHYSYDPLGRLMQIRDAQSNVRSFAYDSLGRRTFQSKLGSGAGWNYEYDANGNLTKKTDPKGQVTSLTYDELDRVLSENDLVFAYDQGNYAIGRLSKVWKPGYEHSFSYDRWGRVVTDHKQIKDKSFDFAYSYDRMGAPTSLTYPDGAVANYRYDAAHQLESLEVNGKTFADSFAYTPMGQITQMTLGNGVVIQNEYDENQLYRLTSKTASDGLQDYSYTYDPVGNLLNMVDANNGLTAKTVSYQYDDLYRLTQADYQNTANAEDLTQTYQYDPLGNMTYKSDVGQLVYQGSHPHAVSQAGSHNYDYDANGNMTVRDDDSMTYDYRDRLTLSAGKASFTYGEGYDRLTKTDLVTGGTTYYPDKYFEVHPEKEVKYIYAGDLRIAKIEKQLAYTPPVTDPTPDPDPNPNPNTDPNPAPDPTPTPTPTPTPVVSQQGTGSATGPVSGGGGGYASQDELRLMRMISEGQMEEAQELSRQIYLYSLNSIEKEKKSALLAGALPESAFDNLRITYNRNSALIVWDDMPKEITRFRIFRSKGTRATPLEDAEVFLEEIEASRSTNRFVHQFDKAGARYAYQIEALNDKGWSLVKSQKLHGNQVFIHEDQQKIVDFRNFSREDFTHVRIKSNEFVDGQETSVSQRLLLTPDTNLEGGARISVNFLTCEDKEDGSKICKKVDSQFVEVYVLNRGESFKKTVTFLKEQVSRLSAAFVPEAHAEEVDAEVYYLLTDHLGSIDVVLGDQGQVVQLRDYLPYGSERLTDAQSGVTETNTKFTGKELDDETNLYYYGARYYDPLIGRFVSMDPVILDEGNQPFSKILQNPQAHNAYSYVVNNPTKFVDPTGMYKKDTHYDLTYFLGLMSGLGHRAAKAVAYFDQYADKNMLTRPENVLATEKYHFATKDDALERLNSAIENESFEEFGTALHTFQDTYSHADLIPKEHLELGDTPDRTALNPAKANRMARTSYFQLRKLNMQLNGTGGLTKDEYIKQTTENWNRFKDEIYRYNSFTIEEKKGTKIEKLARMAEKNKD